MKENMDLLPLFLMVICESVSQKNVRKTYWVGRLYLKDQTQGRVNMRTNQATVRAPVLLCDLFPGIDFDRKNMEAAYEHLIKALLS